jgi:hypothetical protein
MTRRERRDAHARISARIIISLRPYREIRASRCFEILRGISLSRSSDLSTPPPHQGPMFCKTPRERPTDRAPRCTDLRKVPRRHQVDHKRRLLVQTQARASFRAAWQDIKPATGPAQLYSAHSLQKRMMPSCLGSQKVPDVEIHSRCCRFGPWEPGRDESCIEVKTDTRQSTLRQLGSQATCHL